MNKLIVIILLFLIKPAHSQETIVGYYDGTWHITVDFVTAANTALANAEYASPRFTTQEFVILNDSEYLIQLYGTHDGYPSTDRVVLQLNGSDLTTAPAGESHTTCSSVNCLCIVCKKDLRGNCYCYSNTGTCEGATPPGCEQRTYSDPIDVSEIVRTYLNQ